MTLSRPASAEAFARIARTVAGGESSYARLRSGDPVVVERAAGPRIWDADGNAYLDYCGGYGVNLFGHNPAFVWEAVATTVEQLGVHIAFPHRLYGTVGELVAALVPGIEQLRYANSGHRGDPGDAPTPPRRDRPRRRARLRRALPRVGRPGRGLEPGRGRASRCRPESRSTRSHRSASCAGTTRRRSTRRSPRSATGWQAPSARSSPARVAWSSRRRAISITSVARSAGRAVSSPSTR